MARTNKKWIASKKKQLQKQASRWKWQRKFSYSKRRLNLEEAKEFWIVWAKTNPKWNTYNRFLKWRKICWETKLNIDSDWYRLVKLPSWWLEFIEVPVSWWLRKKIMKNAKK